MKKDWRAFLNQDNLLIGDSDHCIRQVYEQISALVSRWQFSGKIIVVQPTAVISVSENFDMLLFPAEKRVRSEEHTVYVDESHVLVSQMSSAIAKWLCDHYKGEKCLILCPGLAYRQNGAHHQLDLWEIDNSGIMFPPSYARERAFEIFSGIIGCDPKRKDDKELPYLIDAFKLSGNIGQRASTIISGGNLKPEFLSSVGVDPCRYSGYALGLSLDRIAMMVKGIESVNTLYSENPRIACQMTNLSAYQPVSKYPAIQRDLSLMVPRLLTKERLTTEVKNLLGAEAHFLEKAEVVCETGFESLPTQARERTGILPEQKNVLLRVVFRSFDRTLRGDEANDMADRICKSVSKGLMSNSGGGD